ncbi:hypothetical protein ES705_24721 [subsurface metagenome]
MNVREAIETLGELRDNPDLPLSIKDVEALAVARVILICLDPSQLMLINSILAMPLVDSN